MKDDKIFKVIGWRNINSFIEIILENILIIGVMCTIMLSEF